MGNDQPLLMPTQLDKLASVDSPTIANVIELFGVRSNIAGYTDSTIKAVYPDLKPVVGYAVTCTYRTSFPVPCVDAYDSIPALIEAGDSIPMPKIVVFEDLDPQPAAAVYGEVMAMTFQKFGYVGLITNGAGRDFEQVRPLKFPCFTSSMNVSHGYCWIPETMVPVTIGGLRITAGQILHADANGIVHIPAEIVGAVAELIDPFMAAEQIVLDYLHGDTVTPKGYADAFAAMRKTTAGLVERARAMVP